MPLIAPSVRPAPGDDGRIAIDSSAITLEPFWSDNHARFEVISYWSRIPMIMVTLSLGWLIFVAARRTFSGRAAVLAVALFAMDPTVLAHGRVVHTDVAAALVYLAFWIVLYRYAQRRGMSRAILLGAVVGLALVTKFSMLPLVSAVTAVSFATMIRRASPGSRRRRVATHALVVALVALLAVNAAYRFQHPPLAGADIRMIEAGSPAILRAMNGLSALFPTYFLVGFYIVAAHDYYGHPAALLGRFSTQGWWWYFPAAFALKSSLPFVLLTIASLSWALGVIARRRDARLILLIVPVALYAGLCMTAHLNIGVRHLLPAYPFLFILGGALLDRLLDAGRFAIVRRVLVAAMLGWAALEAGCAYPSYMTYMNQLAWRGPHWGYLSDSNVEWGDDIKDLADYLRARGQSRVRAALLGAPVLIGHGVEYVDFFSSLPSESWPAYAAIGASFLNGSSVPAGGPGTGRDSEKGRVNFFDAYRRLTPEAVFGGSVYLYRVR